MGLRSPVALKHASFVSLPASGLDFLCGLVPRWLRRRYRLLFRLRVGAHFPLELPPGVSRLLGAPGASGDASGCFGGVARRLLGATRASQRGSWELPRRPGERLGVLLGRLGKPFGAPRERWERKRRKSENHRFT